MTSKMKQPAYLISACLAGQPVRYDGKAFQHQALQLLIQQNKAITACPEMLGGLSCPREPAEIRGGSAQDVLAGRAQVITAQGLDVTQEFLDGAYKTLALVQKNHIQIAVLKENSPSCGSNMIYSGCLNGNKIAGMGITAALLRQHGIQVMSEQEFLNA
ncbi:hypothetical protein B9T34_18420 [Acinetobacter sp. ANC 3813]|nr:hypothetical protein B9T34_18420 [Acinetobacter sp. ANC 3813]